MVLRMRALSGKAGWRARRVLSVALPNPLTIAQAQARLGLLPVPTEAGYQRSPTSLSNVTLLFPGGKGWERFLALPSWDFLNCTFWLLAFCSVNICLGEEESFFTSKEGVTHEMRADHLIL